MRLRRFHGVQIRPLPVGEQPLLSVNLLPREVGVHALQRGELVRRGDGCQLQAPQ
jgi:hypothetical protein